MKIKEEEKNLGKEIENDSVDKNDKNNKDIELKEYIIISKYFEQENTEENENNDNNSKDIYLPTYESLQKLCDPKLIKDFINFDLEKYKSNFTEIIDNNSSEKKALLNLDNISLIKDSNIIPYILIFLGGINSINSIYDFFGDSALMPNEECYIDNNSNYLEYINKIIDYLKNEEKNENIIFNFRDFEPLLDILDKLGISIPKNDKNILYRNLKDSICSMEKNKILVLIAPSNNFWIKSDKISIKNQNYDRKLNNHKNIYYNIKFIQSFFEKVVKHVRCKFGLISSMLNKNIKTCYDGLKIISNQKELVEPIIIDQECHDKIDEKTFYRNMKKIINYLKGNKYDNFDEKNILIIDSEKDKVLDTKNNSIILNLFNEEYIEFEEDKKNLIDNKGDKAIKYIVDLLENCNDDIRSYISKNKVNDVFN